MFFQKLSVLINVNRKTSVPIQLSNRKIYVKVTQWSLNPFTIKFNGVFPLCFLFLLFSLLFCCCLLWNLIDELCGVKHYIHVSNINSKSFFLKLLFPFFKYKTLCFFSYEFIVFNRWKNCLPKKIERRNNKKGWRKNKYWEKTFWHFLSGEKRMYNINFFFSIVVIMAYISHCGNNNITRKYLLWKLKNKFWIRTIFKWWYIYKKGYSKSQSKSLPKNKRERFLAFVAKDENVWKLFFDDLYLNYRLLFEITSQQIM